VHVHLVALDLRPIYGGRNADEQGELAVEGGELRGLLRGLDLDQTPIDVRPRLHELTTAEVCFIPPRRQRSEFAINADWSGSSCAALDAVVKLQADGTQTLTVRHEPTTSQKQALVTVAWLPADIVTLRLLIDPSLNTVNVSVNGEENGTYTYATSQQTTGLHAARLVGSAGDAEFDYVSIRVGEAN
jgi:hypothetical protein